MSPTLLLYQLFWEFEILSCPSNFEEIENSNLKMMVKIFG